MTNSSHSHQIAPDSSQYVEAWARNLIATAGRREARRILDDYKAPAGDKRLAKTDRAA